MGFCTIGFCRNSGLLYLTRMKKVLFLSGVMIIFFASCVNTTLVNPFVETRWELYQYTLPNLANPLPLTDTLFFGQEPNMLYNGNQTVYRIYDTGNAGVIRLLMNGTPFGDISGLVQLSMIQNGHIIGQTFGQIGAQGEYQIWLRKVD